MNVYIIMIEGEVQHYLQRGSFN